MKTLEQPSGTIPVVDHDLQAVVNHLVAGTPIDQELRRRIEAKSEESRRTMLQMHGVHDIGVQIIRDMRDAT
jgi:hypothetical protein